MAAGYFSDYFPRWIAFDNVLAQAKITLINFITETIAATH